ncbi:MAG: pilin, partial [Limisphaerales bacterium]
MFDHNDQTSLFTALREDSTLSVKKPRPQLNWVLKPCYFTVLRGFWGLACLVLKGCQLINRISLSGSAPLSLVHTIQQYRRIQQMKKTQKGFTLIELLVVIAIIGIL